MAAPSCSPWMSALAFSVWICSSPRSGHSEKRKSPGDGKTNWAPRNARLPSKLAVWATTFDLHPPPRGLDVLRCSHLVRTLDYQGTFGLSSTNRMGTICSPINSRNLTFGAGHPQTSGSMQVPCKKGGKVPTHLTRTTVTNEPQDVRCRLCSSVGIDPSCCQWWIARVGFGRRLRSFAYMHWVNQIS